MVQKPRLCYVAGLLHVFDLLEEGGESLVDLAYSQRRKRLENLKLTGLHWCTPETHVGEGAALFAATKETGLEGVVAKRRLLLPPRHPISRMDQDEALPDADLRSARVAPAGGVASRPRLCVVLGLRSDAGIELAGVVDSGYGRDLVEQLPALTRRQLRSLQERGQVWEGDAQILGAVKYLEWSPAGRLGHGRSPRRSVKVLPELRRRLDKSGQSQHLSVAVRKMVAMVRLRTIREAEGLTRPELARRAGVSERTLQRIENEESEPSTITKNRIVKALNRTPNKLKDYTIRSVFGSAVRHDA